MEHLRAFLTDGLSVCLAMLKCMWWCVSFHHSVCFCVKSAGTVAGLTAPHHAHCCLIDSLPICPPSVARDLTGQSSSPPPQFSCFSWPPSFYSISHFLFSRVPLCPHILLAPSPSSTLNVNSLGG